MLRKGLAMRPDDFILKRISAHLWRYRLSHIVRKLLGRKASESR